MTRVQKKALKVRLRHNIKAQKYELKKLNVLGSRLHLRRDRFFRTAFSNIKKEIRLFQRLSAKIK